jgi:hypothetical protein
MGHMQRSSGDALLSQSSDIVRNSFSNRPKLPPVPGLRLSPPATPELLTPDSIRPFGTGAVGTGKLRSKQVRSCRSSVVVGGDNRIVTALEPDGIFGPARKETTNHTRCEIRTSVRQLLNSEVPLPSCAFHWRLL